MNHGKRNHSVRLVPQCRLHWTTMKNWWTAVVLVVMMLTFATPNSYAIDISSNTSSLSESFLSRFDTSNSGILLSIADKSLHRNKRATSYRRVKPLSGQESISRAKKQSPKAPSYLPRILLPDFAVSLPFYGPSVFNINKIRILPPIGPISTSPKTNSVKVNSKPKFDQPKINQIQPIEPNITIDIKRELSNPRFAVSDFVDEEFDILRTDVPRSNIGNKVVSLPKPSSRNFDSRQFPVSTQITPSVRPKKNHWSFNPVATVIPKSFIHNPSQPSVRSTTPSPRHRPSETVSRTFETSRTVKHVTSTVKKVSPKPKPTTRRPKVSSSDAVRNPSRPKSRKQKQVGEAGRCTDDKCRLPNCHCGSSTIPNGLKAKDIPQLVMITFDDSINDLNWDIYREIFTDRVNPNGCPILGTFYVSHEWTDYSQVQTLYAAGHEMASHSITHSFGEKFSKAKWLNEINGQREILHLYGGVKYEDIRGMRAPFLQPGGNNQFEMLHEANFTYDSSLPVFDNSPPFWPYTFDYALSHECMIPPCPTKSFPGLWEVGMVMMIDWRGGRCSMVDACSHPSTEDEVFENLLKNFNRHYLSNKAPFGLYFHSAWFNTQHYRRAFMRFIDHIGKNKDVYFVTKWQLIQWMNNPTPLSRLKSFKPFQCNYKDRKPCHRPTVCNAQFRDGPRYMKTCQKCPKTYPWVGNTGFERK